MTGAWLMAELKIRLKFRIDFKMPLRATPEEALADDYRLREVLAEHAPELLGKSAGRPVPGMTALDDISRAALKRNAL